MKISYPFFKIRPLKKRLLQVAVLVAGITAYCVITSATEKVYRTDGHYVSHTQWDGLLKRYISDKGLVNYAAMKLQAADELDKYVEMLGENPPADTWSEPQQLAYWINTYNAFTLKLILDNYPLQSIRDLNPGISIPFVNNIFSQKRFMIAGEKISLGNIEHGILRKQFDEPRIHFAINCASASCPLLRNEAYTPEDLEAQLMEQAIHFVNDNFRNKISPNHLLLSRIFQWFKGDFTKNGSLIEFINQYAEVKIDSDAKVDFLPYDWTLNEE